jgi:RND family efflux transporter MFP subunit
MHWVKLEMAVVLMLCVTLCACDDKEEIYQPRPAEKWELPLMEPTKGAPVYYTATGTVVSDQRIEVSSKLIGYIKDISVREGDKVTKGQKLITIDSKEIESGIRQAQAAVATAKAAFEDAEIDLTRYLKLFKRGSLSDNEFRKVSLIHKTAEEGWKQAQAALWAAKSLRDYAQISSPVNGVVVNRYKQDGDLALPGVPIVTLEVKKGFLIEIFVPESRVEQLQTGSNVEVSIDGISKNLTGTVNRIVTAADPVTRTYQVKISLPDEKNIRPGMFGRVKFFMGINQSLVIPKKALTERGGLKGVFVVGKDNTARFRWVRAARDFGDHVEIESGLLESEMIVAVEAPRLKDGDKVYLP